MVRALTCSFRPNSTWSFLLPYKSAAQNVPRVSLVTEMLKNTDVARFVTSLLPFALKKGISHHTLIAFNAATLHDFIKRSKSLSEGTVAYLVPALLEPLQQKPKKLSKDAVLGSYILLASLSQKCELSPSALKVVINSMAVCAHLVRGDQFMNSMVAVCESQPALDEFSDKTVKILLQLPYVQISDTVYFMSNLCLVSSRIIWPLHPLGPEARKFWHH
jgi:U3 small nucleolar RNA-associated protein 10